MPRFIHKILNYIVLNFMGMKKLFNYYIFSITSIELHPMGSLNFTCIILVLIKVHYNWFDNKKSGKGRQPLQYITKVPKMLTSYVTLS